MWKGGVASNNKESHWIISSTFTSTKKETPKNWPLTINPPTLIVVPMVKHIAKSSTPPFRGDFFYFQVFGCVLDIPQAHWEFETPLGFSPRYWKLSITGNGIMEKYYQKYYLCSICRSCQMEGFIWSKCHVHDARKSPLTIGDRSSWSCPTPCNH